jgi:pilus assembly protein CpaC
MRYYDTFLRPCILGSICVILFSAPSDAETLQLRPGFQQILDHANVTRISIGNPEVIEARPLPKGDGIIVVGKKEGDTDLVVWEKGKKINWEVTVREKNSLIAEARAFIASFTGLAVTDTGRSVIVSGTVSSVAERKLLEDFAKSRPNIHLRLSLPEEKRSLLSYDMKIIDL